MQQHTVDTVGNSAVAKAPQQSEMITISLLAWEQAQFEIHYLRGVFGTMLNNAQTAGRDAKRVRQDYFDALERALTDHEYRKRASTPLGIFDDA
jgi:hypothetical protein